MNVRPLQYSRHLPGFTLIELLVTSVIMVPVAILTLSIFANVSQFQVERTNSHALVSQMRSVQELVEGDLRQAQYNYQDDRYDLAVLVGNKDDFNTRWEAVVMRLPASQSVDTPLATEEWRMYCVTGGKVLQVRVPYIPNNRPMVYYRIKDSVVKDGLPVGSSCSAALLTSVLEKNTNDPQPKAVTSIQAAQSVDVTSKSLEVQSLHFWGIGQAPNSLKTSGVRLELVGRYNPAFLLDNQPGTQEASNPLVFHSTVTPILP